MPIKTDADIWDRIIRSSWGDLTPAEAKAILRWKFKRADRDRAHKLGTLAAKRRLSPAEQLELERYVHVDRVLTTMHSYARQAMKNEPHSPARRKAS